MRVNWHEFRVLLLYLVTFWAVVAAWTLLIVGEGLTLTLRTIVGVIAMALTLVLAVVLSGSFGRRL